jgi:hypothetical protein
LATAEVAKPTPHYHTALGYRGYLKDLTQGISGNFVNYHNRNDFWLATGKTADPPPVWVPVPPLPIPILVDLPPQDVHWIKNQIDYKPNDLVGPGEYKFYPNNGAGNQVRFEKIFNNDRPVEDPHESMAYVARSRTRALGAEPADGNPAPPGAQEVDLNVEYGFDRPRPHHSGQFQLNIQEMYQSDGTRFTKPLYRRMLEDLRVQPQ